MKKVEIDTLTNILTFHRDSEIMKLLMKEQDYFESISEAIIKETSKNHKETEDKRKKVNYISYKDTLDIVKSFLGSINSRYPRLLEGLIRNGIVNIYDLDDKESVKEFGKEPYFQISKGKITINIPMEHNIEDMFSIVHEFMHYVTCYRGCSVDGFILTENVSITYEMLLYDFLKEKGLFEEDRFAPIATRLLSIEEKSRTILESFENFELSRKKSFKLSDIKEDSAKAERDFEDISKQFIYLFCETLAIHNYHNYKEGIITIKNLEEMCRRLNNNENLESLNFILPTEKPSAEEIASSIDFLENEPNKSNKRI